MNNLLDYADQRLPMKIAVVAAILLVGYWWWHFPLMKYRIKTWLRTLSDVRNGSRRLYLSEEEMRHRVLQRVFADRTVDMVEDMHHKGEITKKQKKAYYRKIALTFDIPDLLFRPKMEERKAKIRAQIEALKKEADATIPGPKPGETTPAKRSRLRVVTTAK